jgi:hypothetical protein
MTSSFLIKRVPNTVIPFKTIEFGFADNMIVSPSDLKPTGFNVSVDDGKTWNRVDRLDFLNQMKSNVIIVQPLIGKNLLGFTKTIYLTPIQQLLDNNNSISDILQYGYHPDYIAAEIVKMSIQSVQQSQFIREILNYGVSLNELNSVSTLSRSQLISTALILAQLKLPDASFIKGFNGGKSNGNLKFNIDNDNTNNNSRSIKISTICQTLKEIIEYLYQIKYQGLLVYESLSMTLRNVFKGRQDFAIPSAAISSLRS